MLYQPSTVTFQLHISYNSKPQNQTDKLNTTHTQRNTSILYKPMCPKPHYVTMTDCVTLLFTLSFLAQFRFRSGHG